MGFFSQFPREGKPADNDGAETHWEGEQTALPTNTVRQIEWFTYCLPRLDPFAWTQSRRWIVGDVGAETWVDIWPPGPDTPRVHWSCTCDT